MSGRGDASHEKWRVLSNVSPAHRIQRTMHTVRVRALLSAKAEKGWPPGMELARGMLDRPLRHGELVDKKKAAHLLNMHTRPKKTQDYSAPRAKKRKRTKEYLDPNPTAPHRTAPATRPFDRSCLGGSVQSARRPAGRVTIPAVTGRRGERGARRGEGCRQMPRDG